MLFLFRFERLLICLCLLLFLGWSCLLILFLLLGLLGSCLLGSFCLLLVLLDCLFRLLNGFHHRIVLLLALEVEICNCTDEVWVLLRGEAVP